MTHKKDGHLISCLLEQLQKRVCFDSSLVYVVSLKGDEKVDVEKFSLDRYTLVLCDKDSCDKLREALEPFPRGSFEVNIGYKLGSIDEVIEQIDIKSFYYRAFDITSFYVLLVKKYGNADKIKEKI